MPDRSLEQRMVALKRANDIRIARAALKKNIKLGIVDVRDVIAAPPLEMENMKVFDLLIAAPKIGRVKASRVMNIVRMSQSKTLGGVSDRQRAELIKEMS